MEAISLHGYSVDQQISTQKPSNPNNNPFTLSRQYVSHILPPSSQYFQYNMGILQLPHDNTILSRSSYPPPSYSAQLPPLLPLPTTAHRHGDAATINRGLSFPPTPHRKPTKSKKKPKCPTNKDHINNTTNSAKKAIINNTIPLKHDPSSQTKSNTGNCGNKSQNTGSRVKVDDDRDDKCENVIFSGAVAFAISPPPSSLPLPTFSLRPKLSCKADASCGIDNGASSDLRRLLRLR